MCTTRTVTQFIFFFELRQKFSFRFQMTNKIIITQIIWIIVKHRLWKRAKLQTTKKNKFCLNIRHIGISKKGCIKVNFPGLITSTEIENPCDNVKTNLLEGENMKIAKMKEMKLNKSFWEMRHFLRPNKCKIIAITAFAVWSPEGLDGKTCLKVIFVEKVLMMV